MVWVLQKYWLPVLILVLAVRRHFISDAPSMLELTCIIIAGTGVLMNLLVVILNGAMPVSESVAPGTIENGARYVTMNEKTRLAWLGDWIDVGWAWFSPGDFLILFGCAGLVLKNFWN